MKPKIVKCPHCNRIQKTLARKGNRKRCVRCERSFEVRV